jgi:putative aldouronate transport system permease protein
MGRKSGRNTVSGLTNTLLNLMFSATIVLCLAPLLLVIIISFTVEDSLLKKGYSFIPDQLSTAAYQYVAAVGQVIFRAYGVSIFVAILGTLLSMTIICLYAYPLSRRGFRYRNQFSFIAFFTMIFGGGLVPWYVVYTQFIPLKNTVWILIVPYLMNAWFMMIMRTFIQTTIHESILESARMDGAGEYRTFFVIVLPLCRAGLATIGLFCVLNYWNDWYLPLIFITDAKLYNIQYLMYQTLMSIQYLMSGSANFAQASTVGAGLPSEGARMAVAVLSIGPIVLAFPFFQRYFVKGLTIGAVKG